MSEFWSSWFTLEEDETHDEQEASTSASAAAMQRRSSLQHGRAAASRKHAAAIERTSSITRSTSLRRSTSLKRTSSSSTGRSSTGRSSLGSSSLSRLLLRRQSSGRSSTLLPGSTSPHLLDRLRADWFGSTPKGPAAPAAPATPKPPLSQRMMDHLVAQVVPADVLKVVATVQSEILQAPVGPPEAALRFVLREARGPVWNWAKGNANTVFLYAGAAVAVCCGAVHTAKAIVKAISQKLRIGRLCAAPLVTFVCDGMLPTGFAGPFLASYVTFKVLMHAQQMAEAQKAGTMAASTDSSHAGTAAKPAAQQQQQAHERSASAPSTACASRPAAGPSATCSGTAPAVSTITSSVMLPTASANCSSTTPPASRSCSSSTAPVPTSAQSVSVASVVVSAQAAPAHRPLHDACSMALSATAAPVAHPLCFAKRYGSKSLGLSLHSRRLNWKHKWTASSGSSSVLRRAGSPGSEHVGALP